MAGGPGAGRRFFRPGAAPSRGGPRLRHAHGGSRPARGRAWQDARARGLRVDLVAEEVRQGRHRRHRGHHSRGGAADGLRRREGVRRERGVVGIEACHPKERKAMMDILTQVRDAIMAVELNRPQKKNALTSDMYALLAEALARAEADPAVRVVLIHGRPDVFTAGNDLEDFMERPPQDEASPVFRFLAAASQAENPLFPALNGPAARLATTLLLHCNLLYAGSN